MVLPNGSPDRSNIESFTIKGVWTGGGAAADCTHTYTDWSKNISSVAYNAATGKYIITTTDGGYQLLPGSHVEVTSATTDVPVFAKLIADSWSSSAKTVEFYAYTLATPTLVDLRTGDKVLISLCFAKTSP